MSTTSIISREVVTFGADAEEITIPSGTNQIWFRKLSADAILTVEINEESATPAVDAEFYQLTSEEAVLASLPFYDGMVTLFLTSPAGSTCQVEFRQR